MNYKCIAFKSVLTTIVVICLISPCSCDNSDNTLNNTTTDSLNLTNSFKTSSTNNNNNNNNINNHNINNNHDNNIHNNKISSKSTVTVNSNDNGAQAIITTDTNTQHQIPLVRLPSNTLLKYTAYKDVSIQHFRIPIDTRSAYFSFKSYEEGKSAFGKCLQCIHIYIYKIIYLLIAFEPRKTQKLLYIFFVQKAQTHFSLCNVDLFYFFLSFFYIKKMGRKSF